jgi:hypothetical protein
MMVTGRTYRELKDVHCWECDRGIRELQSETMFLKWCAYVECRVLLCPRCIPDHEAMHQLAGDELGTIWTQRIYY